MHNDMQEIEYCVGELDEEEYERNCWWSADLQPLAGGCVFEAKAAGTRYVH
jgi:hypothetical protein